MKRLLIGDIHGCYDEFQRLLDLAGLSDGDEIIALGDIVDRGPDSPRVLDFFRRTPQARSLMGNHERKHVRVLRGELAPARSQTITRLQLGDAYPGAVAFMQTLPLWLELPEAILVHGFLEPSVPLDAQDERVLAGTLGGEAMLNSRLARPWYELHTGPKPVVVGHHDYLGTGEPFVHRDRVFGLDTGCCVGRRLTGLLLPEFLFVSVPCRANHWQATQAWFERTRRAGQEPKPWVEAAEAALSLLLKRIREEYARVLSELRAEMDFDGVSDHEQARAFAGRVGKGPLAVWLHRARRGELTRDSLRDGLREPARALALAAELGLWNESKGSHHGEGGAS